MLRCECCLCVGGWSFEELEQQQQLWDGQLVPGRWEGGGGVKVMAAARYRQY